MISIGLLIIVSNVVFVRGGIPTAVMKPVDPYIEEGETLLLNCTLAKIDGINSSSIYIRSKGVNYSHPWVVPLDESTAQLRKENIKITETGAYACMIPGITLGPEARQFVQVYRNPEKPKLINCTLRRMAVLECTWLPTIRDQNRRTNVNKHLKHELTVLKERDERIIHDCSKSQDGSCSVSLVKGGASDGDVSPPPLLLRQRICVGIALSVTSLPFIEVHSDLKCWNLSEIIYPEAPEYLRMEETEEGCLLEWDQPFRELYKSAQLTFYLTLVPNYNKSQKIFAEAKGTSFSLSPCQPHTKYSVCISSMSNLGGFHSEMTDFAFITSPTVPCQQVELSQYSTFIDYHLGRILIYWKPLPRKEFCGLGFGYALLMKVGPSWTESDSWTTLTTGTNSTRWMPLEHVPSTSSSTLHEVSDSCRWSHCTFSIVPKNEIGYQMENMSSFHWNDKSLNVSMVIENLVVEVFGSFAFLSWSFTDARNLSLRSNKSVVVVVYTCSSNALFESVCKNNLNWKIMKTNLEHLNMSVKDANLWDLSYGIAVFVDGVSPEIFWSQRIFNLNGTILRPSQVVIKNGKAASSLFLYWSFSQDECLECPYVVYFGIFYCQSFDHKACSDNVTQVNVSNHLRMSEVHDLEPGAPYLFWMASFSRLSISNYTDKIVTNQQRPETKYIVLICVVIVILIFMLMICIFKNSKKKMCETYKIHVPESAHLEQCRDSADSVRDEVVTENGVSAQIESYSIISPLDEPSACEEEEENRDPNSDYCSGSSFASHRADNLDKISPAKQPTSNNTGYCPIDIACASNASEEEFTSNEDC